MTTHLGADTISDFADGNLSEEESAAASAHLAECPQCREDVTWIRSLRERALELPEEREPPRDAWPRIERRIRGGARPPLDELSAARSLRAARRGFRTEGTRVLRRVAAILLLMGIPAGATYLLMRPGTEDARPSMSAEGPAETGGLEGDARFVANTPETVAAAYEPAIRELREILDANRDRLRPETVDVLEENLRVIDAAIGDFYAALEADPASLDTARLLNGMYETKVQLLRQAASLSRGA